MASTLGLLKRCSGYYHSGELTADCLNNPRPCIRVPRECIKHNAVYTILHYLTDHDFMSPQSVSFEPKIIQILETVKNHDFMSLQSVSLTTFSHEISLNLFLPYDDGKAHLYLWAFFRYCIDLFRAQKFQSIFGFGSIGKCSRMIFWYFVFMDLSRLSRLRQNFLQFSPFYIKAL